MESNKKIRKTVGFLLLGVLIIAGSRVSSCSAPKIKPYSEPVEMPTARLENGRKHFNEYCATCHPGGMAGVGLAIINKPLPEALIRFQIRNGVGVMPAFSEKELKDEEVAAIAEYLVYLRKQD